MKVNSFLVLEDGSIFKGNGWGAEIPLVNELQKGKIKSFPVGEVVFNTAMTGYQEILTDPSYFGQIVTMTTPQIGNYGVNEDDFESARPHVAGFVVLCSPIGQQMLRRG